METSKSDKIDNQHIVNPLFADPMKSCRVPFWAIRGWKHEGLQHGEEPKEGMGKGEVAFFVYGRYQPGHKGHQVVFNKLIEEAKAWKKNEGAEKEPWKDQAGNPASNIFVFTSPKQNPPRISLMTSAARRKKCGKGDTKKASCENPLAPDPKVELLKQQNPPTGPDGSEAFINFINMDKNFISRKKINEALSDLESTPKKKVFEYRQIRTPVAAVALLFRCYKSVKMYVGSDRVDAMRSFLQKTFADKTLGGRLSIESAGERDPESEDVAGMSSSKIRQAAVNIKTIGDADYDIVKENIQIGDVKEGFTEDIIDYIRSAYNVDPKSSWRYADETFESDTEGGGKKRKTRKRRARKKKKTLKRKTKLRKTQKRKRGQKKNRKSPKEKINKK